MTDTLQYLFDKDADILYVSQGTPRADAESDEVGDGIIARFDPATHEVIGFTILNFLKRSSPSPAPIVLPFKADLSVTN